LEPAASVAGIEKSVGWQTVWNWEPWIVTADIYWIDGISCGRLAIVGRPRAGDWLADEIADWKASGLTDIVSLLEAFEVRETGLTHEAQWASNAGLGFESFPIPDRGVPASVPAAHALWADLVDKIRNGRAVGIHCRASIGRAGLMAAGVLAHLGVPPEEAWRRTSAARGRPVPDTDEQRHWLAIVLSQQG
jgi:protein-tyrosine phosphatase